MATTKTAKATTKKATAAKALKTTAKKTANNKSTAPIPNLTKELANHFGFDGFKGPQEKIIESLLSGKDTFVIMPTGGGKSLCYQLPAVISPGVAIVVSPLIALMKNR